MGYLVDVVDPEAHPAELPNADRVFTDLGAAELRSGPPVAYAVVASMSERDEDAVAAALGMRPSYLGVVASRKRFAILRETLLDRGISAAIEMFDHSVNIDVCVKPVTHRPIPFESFLCYLYKVICRRRHVLRNYCIIHSFAEV